MSARSDEPLGLSGVAVESATGDAYDYLAGELVRTNKDRYPELIVHQLATSMRREAQAAIEARSRMRRDRANVVAELCAVLRAGPNITQPYGRHAAAFIEKRESGLGNDA